ncbi:hypothetical protein HK103_005220 [Boothiomyces macroporosus]|uniref:sn-1-specific diacylglycerol lipase n=1 Tax=Boothiomyces macroporosus TaxID=261099 RepID=A0AAD5UG15_9FUNG|nr:hypothetical protein HK103_005220 [Boothiomyces macroporosus]
MTQEDQLVLRTQPRNSTVTQAAFHVTSTVANTTGGLARAGIATAQTCTNIAFETAKVVTKTGHKLTRAVTAGIGLPTIGVDISEFFSLTGIELGHGATNLSLKGTTEIVRVFQQFFGDPFTMELTKEIMKMLSAEISKTGKEMGMLEMWGYFGAWISLQKQTKLRWREEFIFPSVQQVIYSPKTVKEKKFKAPAIWKVVKRTFKHKPVQETARETQFTQNPRDLIIKLDHYVKFANGCYGERALEVMKGNTPLRSHSGELNFYANYCGIATSDIVYMSSLETKSDVFNSTYVPRFIISLDHSEKTIILAFRGTLSARDVIIDLSGELIEYFVDDNQPYLVHSGMLKVVARISAQDHSSGIFKRIKELLEKHPEYSLTLTGHSLGAGIASLLSILWADPHTCRTRKESGLPDRPMQVFAFACPSIMDDRLSDLYSDLIFTVVIGWDWLARVGKAGVLELRDAAIKMKELSQTDPDLYNSISSGKCTKEQLDQLHELRYAVTLELNPNENNYNKIHPPGRVCWIYKSQSDPSVYAIYKVLNRGKLFGEILFDDNMLDHHQPTSYDQVFEQMLQQSSI